MLTRIRSSIVLRTLLVVLGASALTAIVSFWTASHMAREWERQQQKETMEALLDVVEPSASAACFVEDRALAEQVVQGLINNSAIQSAALRSLNGELAHAGRGRVQDRPERESSSIRRRLTSPFSKDNVVGELLLVPDPAASAERVARARALVRMMMLAFTTMLALVLAITIHRTVISPIASLSVRLHSLEAVEGARLHFPDGHEMDEIGRLVKDVNALVERLVNALLNEQDLSEQLELDKRRVQSILENAGSGIFVVRGDGALDAWTPAFLRMLGMEENPPVQGSRMSDLFGTCAVRVEEWLANCRSEGTRQVEILQAPDGEGSGLRWLQLTLDPIGPDWIQGLLDDVTSHREATVAAEALALTDPLTGTYNRLGVERALKERLSKRKGGLGLMLLDLDLFKQINDTHGHDAGDEVLRQVTRRLESILRHSDTVGRLGGDEFMVLVDALESREVAHGIGRKIIQAIGEPIALEGGIEVHVGVSIGLTLCRLEEAPAMGTLIKQADLAMYEAKHSGRNRCRLFDARISGQDSA